MANTVGSLLIRIGASIGDLQKNLDKAERSMMRFSNKMQSIGTQLSATVTLPILGIGAAALRSFGDMEKLEKGMATIMGSSEAAAEELTKLKKAAEATGLGFEQAVAGSIRLQAVGMSADAARETLVQFGNAIATTGGGAEDLDQVTRQLTQMISKNRILQEDFMVLQERMPMVSQAMQKAFGHSNIELIRESGMEAKDFVATLTESLATIPRVEGGFSNAFENMQMAVKGAMAQIGEAINTSLDVTGKMEKFAGWIQQLADWFDGLSESQKRFAVTAAIVAAAIGPVLVGISTMVKMASTAVVGLKALLSVFAVLTSPIGLIVAGVVALAAGFAYAYNK
jgi:tape measure domain-containing protein